MVATNNGVQGVTRTKLLRDQVYEILRDRLLQGLPTGYRLVEEEIAKQLGVSRTPVREALQRLEIEGLVFAPGVRGFEAAPFGPSDIAEALDIREILESYAACKAAVNITREQLEELRQFCKCEQEMLDKDPSGLLRELLELNQKLHQLIIGCADNRILSGIIKGLPAHSAYRLFALGKLNNRRRFAESHCRLVAALEAHDPEAAAAESAYHIQLMKDILGVASRQ